MYTSESVSSAFWSSMVVPFFIVLVMWSCFVIELELNTNFAPYGLFPRKLTGLRGILTMPFIHSSWSHLINNSIPMLILGWALFKFYRVIALKTLLWIFIMSGIWLWISGRASFHIGASGVVYGLASFLFLSGWLRREKRVAALSLLVAFLYGGLWWGVLPIDPSMSWEGHFWGALAGLLLAIVYRRKGIQKKVYQWELDELDQEDENYDTDVLPADGSDQQSESPKITYDFIPSPKGSQNKLQ